MCATHKKVDAGLFLARLALAAVFIFHGWMKLQNMAGNTGVFISLRITPAAVAARERENHDFQPPLDIVDGAARVCDPFFNGILTGKHFSGKFLKDYFPVEW